MGKTSRNTAWRPVSLRLESAKSVCKNSTYELSWISMRFGGSAPSLSLPKLMRSDIRVRVLLLIAGRRGEKSRRVRKSAAGSSRTKTDYALRSLRLMVQLAKNGSTNLGQDDVPRKGIFAKSSPGRRGGRTRAVLFFPARRA